VRTLPIVGLVALALTGIANAGVILETPWISGDVSTYENRKEISHRTLSSEQLQALTRWLEQHRRGWRGMLTEASTAPAQWDVSLKNRDGRTTSIAAFAQADGGHHLLLIGPGKWAYRSFGGIWKSWAATRPLSDPELAELEVLIGAM
jgi:hypothetical protein